MPAWEHLGVILSPNTVGPGAQMSRAVEGRRFTLVRHQVTLSSRCVKLEFGVICCCYTSLLGCKNLVLASLLQLLLLHVYHRRPQPYPKT